MAEFVRAQIFGTTFEITSRYTELQPVGMGAFGLVWYVAFYVAQDIPQAQVHANQANTTVLPKTN
jgi:p38 MAP kinase